MASLPNRPTDFSAPDVARASKPGGARNGRSPSNGHDHQAIATDNLVIGGGFGGMYGLHQMRQLGLTVKLFVAGADFGRTWY
jgi:NADPH-dependent 2,4-dienoyl-CoA reductase/sulfur reductase-like enzyme